MKQSSFSQKSSSSGFTLVELLTVISIIAVLATMIAVVLPGVKEKATTAGCISNMRALYGALGLRTADLGHWPQLPESYFGDERAAGEFWRDELMEYGMSESMWSCPGLEQMAGPGYSDLEFYERVTYHPTPFDDIPSTPTRWISTMPWAIEVGGDHPTGLNVLMGDGRVINAAELQTQGAAPSQ